MDEQGKMKDEIERKKFNAEMKGFLPWLKRLGIVVLLVGTALLGNIIFEAIYYPWTEVDENGVPIGESSYGEGCTVAAINLHGHLVTYVPEHSDYDSEFDLDTVSSEDITYNIELANEDENIKAILIEVDSGGGSPVAGEEVASAVKQSAKPVVAFIRDLGASASYWAISPADRIFASKNSDIGSIGVTQSYLQDAGKNKKDGYEFVELNSVKFKEIGNPDIPITPEIKDILLRDLRIVHQNFVNAIAEYRNLPVEKVQEIADGSTVLGEKAKELGLIDEIGGYKEAQEYLDQILGEETTICWN